MKNATQTAEQTRVLLVASAAAFLSPFMVSAVNVALPSIGRDLGIDAADLGWVTTTYLVAVATLLLPLGRLGDLRGRKPIFLTGVGLFVFSCLFCALATSTWTLLVGRALQGIGAGIYVSTGVALVTTVFPAEIRGRALGITVGSVYAGLSLGPIAGGIVTEYWGWRSVFLVGSAIASAIFAIGLSRLRPRRRTVSRPFDFPGAVLYVASIGLLVYGLQGLPDVANAIICSLGIAGMISFFRWEKSAPSPLLNPQLLGTNRTLRLSGIVALSHYAATFAVLFILSLYLQLIRGYSAKYSGAILLAQPIVQMILSPLMGRLADRFSASRLVTAGMVCTITALLTLATLNSSTSMVIVFVSLVMIGAAFALFASPNAKLMMDSVGRSEHGAASGVLATTRVAGQLASMAVVMSLLGSQARGTFGIGQASDAFLTGSRNSFLVLAALAAVGALVSRSRDWRTRPLTPEG